MPGSGPSLASGDTVLVIMEDMPILLSRGKTGRRKADFYGNPGHAQSLEKQRPQRLRFPES